MSACRLLDISFYLIPCRGVFSHQIQVFSGNFTPCVRRESCYKLWLVKRCNGIFVARAICVEETEANPERFGAGGGVASAHVGRRHTGGAFVNRVVRSVSVPAPFGAEVAVRLRDRPAMECLCLVVWHAGQRRRLLYRWGRSLGLIGGAAVRFSFFFAQDNQIMHGNNHVTRIVIADDHSLFRQGLRALIEAQPGLCVVGEAEDGREALEVVAASHADLLVADLIMPELNGVEMTRLLLTTTTRTKVLIISGYSMNHLIRNALEAGALGFVPKTALFKELVDAIDTVMKGRIYLGPNVADMVIQQYVRHGGDGHKGPTKLTPREREVLRLISEGHRTKEIAAQLRVSIKTIGTYRVALQRKLSVHGVAELTKYALREGITALDA